MVNQYGQTDLVSALMKSQPKQGATPLGTALRLGAVGLAQYGQNQKEAESRQMMADYLRSINSEGAHQKDERGALGPTVDAAQNAPIKDPDQLAAMLMNPSTSAVGNVALARALEGEKVPEPFTLSPGQVRYGGNGQMIANVPKPVPQTNAMRNAMYAANGDEARARALVQQGITRPGTTVNVTNNPPLGKKAQGRVEDELLDTGAQMQRIQAIASTFRPEFLERGTQIKNYLAALQDRTIGGLSEEAKGELRAYTDFTTNTLTNLNRSIKELTGAAMTESEAARIIASLPNKDDSPTVFKSKLDNALGQMRLSMARLNYIRKNGLELGSVSIDGMKGLMRDHARSVSARLMAENPDMPASERIARLRSSLISEFGLVGE